MPRNTKSPVAQKIDLFGSNVAENTLAVIQYNKIIPRALIFKKFNFHLKVFQKLSQAFF